MRCAVCSLEGAKQLKTVAGEHLGYAHDGECVALLWESHFVRVTGGSEWEHAEVLWRWQRQAAAVAGLPFTTPPPLSPAHEASNLEIERLGLCDVAEELA